MRSIGIIYDQQGQHRASWHWQDRTRGCPFHLPVQHGDEVVLLDPEHPDCPDELDHSQCETRDEIRKHVPDEAMTEVTVSLPHAPDHDHFLTPGLMVVKRPKGQPSATAVHEPLARIERRNPQGGMR